jgi:uncharacterized protein YoxC
VTRHLVNHDHICPNCEQLHLVVIDLQPLERVLAGIKTELRKLGRHMATIDDNIATITTQVDSVSTGVATLATAFTDLAADVRAVLNAPAGDASPEQQAAFDTLAATLETTSAAAAGALADLAALDAEVGDADGSDTPV